jgi:hypothetical protein
MSTRLRKVKHDEVNLIVVRLLLEVADIDGLIRELNEVPPLGLPVLSTLLFPDSLDLMML